MLRYLFWRYPNLIKKKILITIDVILIGLSLIFPGWILYHCIDAAINGCIPWGGGYPEGYGMIYGFPAFMNTLGTLCVLLAAAVILWAMFAFATLVYTIITVIICKSDRTK